ncbi:MAG: NUDIX domain-containing protein [Candidatus Moranbacteria bacterium]|jgi:8-oxo-dGTP pyrophosphatase MutT (NUDIX family)|nr:NUDIX domain-containing protein [Candidatus Moranbacteria bacterium]
MICFEKSSGVVVFRRDGEKIKYLLLQYRNNHWSFPKGHIEDGESLLETAKRETKEETGIDDLEIFPGFSRCIYFYYKATGQEKEERIKAGRKIRILKKVNFFLGKTKKTDVVLSEEQVDFAWFEFDEALERTTYPKDRSILVVANQYLKKAED